MVTRTLLIVTLDVCRLCCLYTGIMSVLVSSTCRMRERKCARVITRSTLHLYLRSDVLMCRLRQQRRKMCMWLQRVRSEYKTECCQRLQTKWGQCTYELTLWRVRVIFVPPRLCSHLDPTSFQESACMAIYCHRQQQHMLRYSREVPDFNQIWGLWTNFYNST